MLFYTTKVFSSGGLWFLINGLSELIVIEHLVPNFEIIMILLGHTYELGDKSDVLLPSNSY